MGEKKRLTKKQVWDTLKTPYDPRSLRDKFEDEMIEMMTKEIREEIDKELLEKLKVMSRELYDK